MRFSIDFQCNMIFNVTLNNEASTLGITEENVVEKIKDGKCLFSPCFDGNLIYLENLMYLEAPDQIKVIGKIEIEDQQDGKFLYETAIKETY